MIFPGMNYQVSKRVLDLAAAVLGFLLLVPVGLLLGLLIKLSDRGPVFYRQTRIGQFGKPFRIWKFRTMVVNADRLGLQVTRDRDPRITPIGRFLRKSKLDELPQLLNVLSGEMSFVGPRPEVPKYVELYTPDQREVLKLKPGITDLASIMFRNEEELLCHVPDAEEFYIAYCLPRKIELNRGYAARAGLFRDLGILLCTVSAVLFGSPKTSGPAGSERTVSPARPGQSA
jgi:lipopolysaccharide/colanic/teichoic acid biosynthesis glycosyltransferase